MSEGSIEAIAICLMVAVIVVAGAWLTDRREKREFEAYKLKRTNRMRSEK